MKYNVEARPKKVVSHKKISEIDVCERPLFRWVLNFGHNFLISGLIFILGKCSGERVESDSAEKASMWPLKSDAPGNEKQGSFFGLSCVVFVLDVLLRQIGAT